MGFKLAIVPGLLLKAVIGACDAALAELKATHVHPAPRERHDGARGVQSRRRRGMGCVSHAIPRARRAARRE